LKLIRKIKRHAKPSAKKREKEETKFEKGLDIKPVP